MIYVTSDIHGHFDKYQKLLQTIRLSPKDALIILGDFLDRGPHPINLLFDIMSRPNVFPIIGNHEKMAMTCLPIFTSTFNDQTIAALDSHTRSTLDHWLNNLGGNTTLDGFLQLNTTDKKMIVDYLDTLPVYGEIKVNKKTYWLVHGGLKNFSIYKKLDDYTDDEIVWDRLDYTKQYFYDKIIVSGHTPTANIKGNRLQNFIYQRNNHIALDCGQGVGSNRLGCICLNDLQEYYV